MSFVLGFIMFIGGIVLCFSNDFNTGLVFFTLSSILMIGWDISASIRCLGEKGKANEITESVKELNKLIDFMEKMDNKD